MTFGIVFALLGAAIAVTIPGVSSAIGIGYVGQASAGAMSDNPKNFGRF